MSIGINIVGTRSFESIQKEFSTLYPFLKLDFYKPAARTEKVYPAEKLKRYMEVEGDPVLNVQGTQTIRDLIQDLETIIPGVNAVILRKSGTLWIETSLTLDWTLDRQNREGELISNIH